MISPNMVPRTLRLLLGTMALSWCVCPVWASPVVQETESEFITQADLNGDGRPDVVLVDKATGRVRPGYQQADGRYQWVDWRDSGASGVTGLSVGRLLSEDRDGLALSSRDGNTVRVLDVSEPTTPSAPVEVPFLLLGPACVVAVELGGKGNTPLHDLFVGSVYNTPDANMASLFRNAGGRMEQLVELPLPGVPARGNRVQLADGGPEFLAVLFQTDTGTSFRIQSFAEGEPATVTSFAGLEPEVNYTFAKVRGLPLNDLLLWTPGRPTVVHRPVLESAPGRYQFGPARPLDLGGPIRSVATLPHPGQSRLFVVQGDGATAGLYGFDSSGEPSRIQTLQAPTNHVFTGALPAKDGLVVFCGLINGGSSVRYQLFHEADGTFKEGVYGRLPTLADNDNLTIPDLHARIVERADITNEASMRPYTNTIPGTPVTYAMMPIPGGEFVMGSPATETGRRPDEGPQHKVRLAPFWMGRCEVTWKEFELFMYPDAEKKLRKANASDAGGDRLADAITHPSKPYTDMTFGMGREGYPAIAMTQHAANKYCQWLSAKTGHFYRLPTEAEWEYAARAGTATAYFFGDDDSALDDYAWFELNSDFKYQKVGRKQPNPWGLHDIYGNVVEWVLDQYDPGFYSAHSAGGPIEFPWNKATKPYPHSVRGGSWDDPVGACRSAARRGSDPRWKLQDPQLPKSIWYFTDADFIGFRIVRPLGVPGPDAMQAYWNSSVERE